MLIDRKHAKPLYKEASRGNTELVLELIASGADVNHKTLCERNTALHAAALGGHVETVKALLAHGAKINVENSGFATPLDNAIILQRGEIIELLKSRGAERGYLYR